MQKFTAQKITAEISGREETQRKHLEEKHEGLINIMFSVAELKNSLMEVRNTTPGRDQIVIV